MIYMALLGSGFQPKETAEHHREYVFQLIHKALEMAKLTMKDISMRISRVNLLHQRPRNGRPIVSRSNRSAYTVPIISNPYSWSQSLCSPY